MLAAARMVRRTAPFVRSRALFSNVQAVETGTKETDAFRVNFKNEKGVTISPWHDIPLRNGPNFNFITEIPKFTKAKMEIATKEAHNPIAQDKKNGQLREYCGPIYWNYGCLPQTWEDPSVFNENVQCRGDNDPVDVVEIGSAALPCGSVTQVKILGALAMVDDGELDWKMIAINSNDVLFDQLHDIQDVEEKCPGVVSGIREWFRWYKTPDKKPLNKFGFNDQALGKKDALIVIEETHVYWKKLRDGETARGKLWVK